MKKIAIILSAIATATCFSGCLGDSNKSASTFVCIKAVHNVNCTITDNKWINEILFIIPGGICYGIASFLDVIIFNSIHFWTDGDNPIAQTTLTDANGVQYVAEKQSDGSLKVTNQETQEVLTLVYDQANNTLIAKTKDAEKPLAKLVDNNKAIVYSANGTQEVSL